MSINLINPINHNEPVIIGIDHGYGNIKTTHCCFKTGVAAYDKEPTFKSNLLVYEGRFYLIGEEHKEFTADKMLDSDYYILTLAAIGRELNIRKQTSARVHIAAGLPLTWVSEQKDAFKAYLLQNESADFNFRGMDYHVDFAGLRIQLLTLRRSFRIWQCRTAHSPAARINRPVCWWKPTCSFSSAAPCCR